MEKNLSIERVSEEKPARHTLVVLVQANGDDKPVALTNNLSADLARGVRDAVEASEFKGKKDALRLVPAPGHGGVKHLLLVGIGKELSAGSVRQALATAFRSCEVGAEAAAVLPDEDDKLVEAALEGIYLGAYRFNRYRKVEEPQLESVGIICQGEHDASFERARILASAQYRIRDLGNTAPNDLYPETFVELIKKWAKPLPVEVEVWDEKRLAKEGCGGILGVGQGSARPPRLVKVTYNGNPEGKKVALVGKGITFDTGGISIKPAGGMEAMKSDMLGAATMLNTVLASAELKSKVNLVAFLALAENMPGGNSYRPGDILTISDGTTVEITNTDAEGRMVMSDAIVQATKEDPALIVDMATLTGAQIVALGKRTAGVMGTEEFREGIYRAACAADELMWPMPIPEYLRDLLKSDYADLINAGPREAGMLMAGSFLQHFAKDFPFVHIDIAGPSYNEGSPWGTTGKGATGMGLRTLVTYFEDFAS